MNWKTLVTGIVLIVLIGIAGFFYRSVKESPSGPVACTTDARICPDGTGLGRTGPNCTFPVCPAPNVELSEVGIAYALPAGYTTTDKPDEDSIAAYLKTESSGVESYIYIRDYLLTGSTTAADFIRGNAIMDASGAPASPSAFSSVVLGPSPGHRFSVVTLGRFEGVVDTTYYLSRAHDVLRFDAQSRNVTNWTDPSLDVSTLPANVALKSLLSTLQGN